MHIPPLWSRASPLFRFTLALASAAALSQLLHLKVLYGLVYLMLWPFVPLVLFHYLRASVRRAKEGTMSVGAKWRLALVVALATFCYSIAGLLYLATPFSCFS